MIPNTTRLHHPSVIICLLVLLGNASADPLPLHPEADLFRTAGFAYIVSPAYPSPDFGYVTYASSSHRGSDWILVEHRERTSHDSATTIAHTDPSVTKWTLFNPRTNQRVSLPTSKLPSAKNWRHSGGRGDIVIVNAYDGTDRIAVKSHSYAVNCSSGETLNLSIDANVFVIDDSEFLVQSENSLSVMNWSGEHRPLRTLPPSSRIHQSRNAEEYFVIITSPNRVPARYILAINSGQLTQMQDLDYHVAAWNSQPDISVRNSTARGQPHYTETWISGNNPYITDAVMLPVFFTDHPSGLKPHEHRTGVRVLSTEFARSATPNYGLIYSHELPTHYCWYLQDHAIILRRIENVPLAQYEEHVKVRMRTQAEEYARQVAGWATYALNQSAESARMEMRDLVSLYMNDESLLSQFVFSGKASEFFADPAQTMGYLDTPYGRANVTWDRKVSWVPKPAP